MNITEPVEKKRRLMHRYVNKKRESSKISKVRGEEYVTHKGEVVPSKDFILVSECCKNRCYEHFPLQDQCNLFDSFYNGQNKALQDAYLSACMTLSANINIGNNQKKPRLKTWSYSMKQNGTQVMVCQKFLLTIFQISVKRLRVIQSKSLSGADFQERRGTHDNRPHKLHGDVVDVMKAHLQLIPSDFSHYCAHKTNLKYFENPELTVKSLFDMFKIYYQETTNRPLKLSYEHYRKLFKSHFKYGFTRPKTDICDFCCECSQKLLIDANDPCKVNLEIHKRKYKKHHSLRADFISKAKDDNASYLVVEFDYGQNYPIPKLSVNSQFYKRCLWLYVFNVHVFNDDSSYFYCHMETQASKNSNSVVSFVYDTLKKNLQKFPNTKTIVLMSDATGGQNRNATVTKFCTWFAKTHEIEVVHLYPVRGHSFSQCDRNFGLVRSKIKKREVIGSASPWLEAIVTCRENPSRFEMTMDRALVKDWETALSNFFLPAPKSTLRKFTIMKFVMMKYTKSGSVLCSENYFPMYTPFTYLATFNLETLKNVNLTTVPFPTVSACKIDDVRSLCTHLPQRDCDWIEQILDEPNQ